MQHLARRNIGPLVFILFSFMASAVGAIVVSSKILYASRAHPLTTATLETNYGNIKIKFLKSKTKSVENFIKLASSGFYDKTHFHRVVPGAMIQGGDPLSKFTNNKSEWGKGGPGYTFPDELTEDDLMVRGAVGMANNGPDTNGSQFFILAEDSAWLVGHNTIFAYVVEGMDTVDKIASTPVGTTGIPSTDIELRNIAVN